MASITYWNRLIPQPLGTSLEPGVAAQVYDPMWTLARQLQLGEFLGVDGGSPAFVEIGTRTTPFTRSGQPLEPLTESEPVTPDLALRIEPGQVLESMIDQMVSPAMTASSATSQLRAKYPLPATVGASGAGLLAACAGRVLDGVALYEDLVRGSAPALDPTTTAALQPAYLAFLAWVTDVVGEIGTDAAKNWDASSLRYSIAMATTLPDGRTAEFTAEPDRAAQIEWYSFDLSQAGTGGSPAPAVKQSVLPIRVRFRGMPNERFWDFESNKTEYGDVIAGIPDAGRLLFLDFMLIHGVGWYVAPLDVSIGAICQVDSLTVYDVFGGATTIPRADATLGPAGARFTLFSTTEPRRVAWRVSCLRPPLAHRPCKSPLRWRTCVCSETTRQISRGQLRRWLPTRWETQCKAMSGESFRRRQSRDPSFATSCRLRFHPHGFHCCPRSRKVHWWILWWRPSPGAHRSLGAALSLRWRERLCRSKPCPGQACDYSSVLPHPVAGRLDLRVDGAPTCAGSARTLERACLRPGPSGRLLTLWRFVITPADGAW
jgi:hypothetical protein